MSNLLKFYQINSFTTKPLTGNPAGVILCQETWPENIQKIASEINQNETAFILPIKNSNSNFEENAFKVDKKFKLRWLTPTCEVPLCGHATLAAASVLFEVCKNENQVLEFETLSGILKAERDDKNNNTGIILDFPADVPVALEDLDSINHIIPYVINPIIPACGDFDCIDDVNQIKLGRKTRKLIVELNSSSKNLSKLLDMAVPDPKVLTNLHDGSLFKGICFTMKNPNIIYKNSKHDIISRYFAPWLGLNEDHVTGSLHTTLAPFYMEDEDKRRELGKSNPNDRISARQCSPRNGEMFVEWDDEKGRVFLIGRCCHVIEGVMNVG